MTVGVLTRKGRMARLLMLMLVLMGGIPNAVANDNVTTAQVGYRGCVEGFIMDFYCIEEVFMIDNFGVKTLEGPEKHSIHCLVDVYGCRTSPYEVLVGNMPPYQRGWRVDRPAGQDTLIALARSVGDPQYGCSTCTATQGSVARGFRAAMVGTVLDVGVAASMPNGDDFIPATFQVEQAVAFGSCATDFASEMPLVPPVPGKTSTGKIITRAPTIQEAATPTDAPTTSSADSTVVDLGLLGCGWALSTLFFFV